MQIVWEGWSTHFGVCTYELWENEGEGCRLGRGLDSRPSRGNCAMSLIPVHSVCHACLGLLYFPSLFPFPFLPPSPFLYFKYPSSYNIELQGEHCWLSFHFLTCSPTRKHWERQSWISPDFPEHSHHLCQEYKDLAILSWGHFSTFS